VFGFGLTYTTLNIFLLSVVGVTFMVRNSGAVAGTEHPHLYPVGGAAESPWRVQQGVVGARDASRDCEEEVRLIRNTSHVLFKDLTLYIHTID